MHAKLPRQNPSTNRGHEVSRAGDDLLKLGSLQDPAFATNFTIRLCRTKPQIFCNSDSFVKVPRYNLGQASFSFRSNGSKDDFIASPTHLANSRCSPRGIPLSSFSMDARPLVNR